MLRKLQLRPGVNRENTRYTNENGWYDCDKIRFRQGTPEKIGGWQRISNATFEGVCRSLWNWVTLGGANLVGIGTNLKFYIEQGGAYYDITPLRKSLTLGANPFTGNGTATVMVFDLAHGLTSGDYVVFSGATGPYAALLNNSFVVTVLSADTYTITVTSPIPAVSTGGSAVFAQYLISPGPEVVGALTGWGAGAWGAEAWGIGGTSDATIRLWRQSNFGEDLAFGYRGGPIYYWDASTSLNARGVALDTLPGASGVPLKQNLLFVSDSSRFLFALGCTDIGGGAIDPMLIRWSDQENALEWVPSATNQAGSLRLSAGSEIVTAVQTRQEIVVLTDSSVYSIQYLGAPDVWGAQLVGPNTSIISTNGAVVASGVVYWMGVDKFYMYDGRVQTLNCDLRRYVFSNLNQEQQAQIFAGTNEGYNEVWWFYPSAGSMQIDSYVVFNYAENIWYYGTMGRTAWLDSGLKDFPMAATYSSNLVEHENGVDDAQDQVVRPLPAYITSAEFDIEDGHKFGFVRRMVPDITFAGSTTPMPRVTMTLTPLKGSGSGPNTPASVGGSDSATVMRTSQIPIEQFTNLVYIRVRGRQMTISVRSDDLGVSWQLGAPRIDVQPDGRK